MKLKSILGGFVGSLAITTVLLAPTMGLAANPFERATTKVDSTVKSAQLNSGVTDLPTLLGSIVNTLLGIVGLFLVITFIIAGVQWATAAGDSDKIKHAKDTMTNTVIGIIIIVAAFAISQFVVNALESATEESAPAAATPPPPDDLRM